MANSRVARGRRTNVVVAMKFQERGVQDAEATFGSEKGRDIKKVPCLAPEVKARRDFHPLEWLKQAKSNAGDDLPVVVMRGDGQGESPAAVDDYLLFMRFSDALDLFEELGFWENSSTREEE